MKGIVLAGGHGTRLYPITLGASKQLLPVYDKPMIYYPLSTLMLAGIRDILIISTEKDLPKIESIFKSGKHLGINIDYLAQKEPEGIAQALVLAKEYLAGEDFCLILGDNLLYGHGLLEILWQARLNVLEERKSVIFGHYVSNPKAYGVVSFDSKGKALSIEEKPKNPQSHFAIVGLYFYPNEVLSLVDSLSPSSRGEYEISSLNQLLLLQQKLHISLLGRGYAWLDLGTADNLLEASNLIRTLEKRQGLKVACLEEIAYLLGYISPKDLSDLSRTYKNSSYGTYLKQVSQTPPQENPLYGFEKTLYKNLLKQQKLCNAL